MVSHVWGKGGGRWGGYPLPRHTHRLDIPHPWKGPGIRDTPWKGHGSRHGQTDTCENITFSQLRLRVVMIRLSKWGVWNHPWRGSRRGSSPVPHCVHVEFRAKSWHRLPNAGRLSNLLLTWLIDVGCCLPEMVLSFSSKLVYMILALATAEDLLLHFGSVIFRACPSQFSWLRNWKFNLEKKTTKRISTFKFCRCSRLPSLSWRHSLMTSFPQKLTDVRITRF